jgi:hypothetical protein
MRGPPHPPAPLMPLLKRSRPSRRPVVGRSYRQKGRPTGRKGRTPQASASAEG